MTRTKDILPKHNSIIVLSAFILFLGLVFLASSSQVYSMNVYNNPFKLSLLQLGWMFIGSLAFAGVYFTDLKKLRSLGYILFYANIFFLVVLGIMGMVSCDTDIAFAPCIKGARRWLYLNPAPLPSLPFLGVVGFQPGELIKLSLILYLSFQLEKIVHKGEDPFWFYIVTTGLASILIILQPNMSTAILIFAIGSSIFFISGANMKKFLMLLPVLALMAALLVLFSPYRRARLASLLNGGSSNDSNYHVRQILISLGSGGVSGVGFGQSKQKYSYLPEVAADSIFGIIGEEFGFIGTFSIVLVFGYLIYKSIGIALSSDELVYKMLAVGITTWIGLQFFVNVAAMVHIIPLTGVPLPLMSYGGSSLIFTMMGLGVLAKIEHEKN
jgi:cell division protein FtsW